MLSLLTVSFPNNNVKNIILRIDWRILAENGKPGNYPVDIVQSIKRRRSANHHQFILEETMKHITRSILPLLVLLAVLLSACSSAATEQPAAPAATEKLAEMPATEAPAEPTDAPIVAPAEIQEIAIEATDFTYSVPENVVEGWVRVNLTNSGSEPYHVQFLRLNDGVTYEQFQEALKQGAGPAMALVQQVGGVGAIAPTMSAEVVLNMPAGEYVMLDLIPSPSDNMPHFTKGMIANFPVLAAEGEGAAEPQASLTIDLQDFTFEMPNSLPVGESVIKVANNGPEAHEWNLLLLAEGKTADDVEAFLSGAGGPPPFAPIGGINGMDKGLHGYAEVNLQPGRYAAICNIPSPNAGGQPHHALGMIKEFTVGDVAAAPVAAPAAAFPIGQFVSNTDAALSYIFNADGTFSYMVSQTPVLNGTYEIQGDVFQELSNDDSDPACQNPPPYKWSFDGATLSFSRTEEDACRGRREANADTYTLVMAASGEFPTGRFISNSDAALVYVFNADGTFSFVISETPVLNGTYEINGDLFQELTNDDSEPTCQEHPAYQWVFDGTTLSFMPTGEDTCRGRSEAMADTYTIAP